MRKRLLLCVAALPAAMVGMPAGALAQNDGSARTPNATATTLPAVQHPRWMPRHAAVGVGGVATSPPGRGRTFSPVFGGALELSMIGLITPRTTWRAEAFVHLHDRNVASEDALLAGDALPSCIASPNPCNDTPHETARRTSGAAMGVEYHPMRGRVGVYGLALLGIASSNSYGDAGRDTGFSPSLGVGLLAPLTDGLDGFALELRWRRVPTAIGAVSAGVVSLQLRF